MTARIGKLRPDELDASQQRVYEAIAGGRRAHGPQLFRLTDDSGGLEGPFNAMLLAPRLGLALQALGGAIRYETSLTDRAREIAILIVAAYRDSAFERYAHEAVGRHVGLSDTELDALRASGADVFTDPIELAVARTAGKLLTDGDLSDDEYAEAAGVLGESGLFELITLVGYYDLLALQLRVFRVAAPDLDTAH